MRAVPRHAAALPVEASAVTNAERAVPVHVLALAATNAVRVAQRHVALVRVVASVVMNAVPVAQRLVVHGRARLAVGYLLLRVQRAAPVEASRQMPVVVAAQGPSINGRRVDIPVTSAVAQVHQLHVNLALSARQLALRNVRHPAVPPQRHRHVAHGNHHNVNFSTRCARFGSGAVDNSSRVSKVVHQP